MSGGEREARLERTTAAVRDGLALGATAGRALPAYLAAGPVVEACERVEPERPDRKDHRHGKLALRASLANREVRRDKGRVRSKELQEELQLERRGMDHGHVRFFVRGLVDHLVDPVNALVGLLAREEPV